MTSKAGYKNKKRTAIIFVLNLYCSIGLFRFIKGYG